MRRDQKADVGATVSDFVGWHAWTFVDVLPSLPFSAELPAPASLFGGLLGFRQLSPILSTGCGDTGRVIHSDQECQRKCQVLHN